MKVEFKNCSIQNQQNFDNGSYAINYVNNDSFNILRETISHYCNDEERSVIVPIVDELENEKKKGTLKKTDVTGWLNRIKDVAAIGGSVAAISNAAWWPTVSQVIQNIFSNLP